MCVTRVLESHPGQPASKQESGILPGAKKLLDWAVVWGGAGLVPSAG